MKNKFDETGRQALNNAASTNTGSVSQDPRKTSTSKSPAMAALEEVGEGVGTGELEADCCVHDMLQRVSANCVSGAVTKCLSQTELHEAVSVSTPEASEQSDAEKNRNVRPVLDPVAR